MTSLPKSFALSLIRLYQAALSPFTGNCCRFAPSCSHYAQEAVERHGALKGAWLAFCRVLRCHPFAKAGFDPVPEK
jgi:uncharacterized protein